MAQAGPFGLIKNGNPMKINAFISFIFITIIAHFVTWLQINSQFLNPKFKYSAFLLLLGIPISWLWIKSTGFGVSAFDGKFWPQRLIAFSIGIILYTILTGYFFGEKFDLKSAVCLALAFAIVGIQVLWK